MTYESIYTWPLKYSSCFINISEYCAIWMYLPIRSFKNVQPIQPVMFVLECIRVLRHMYVLTSMAMENVQLLQYIVIILKVTGTLRRIDT